MTSSRTTTVRWAIVAGLVLSGAACSPSVPSPPGSAAGGTNSQSTAPDNMAAVLAGNPDWRSFGSNLKGGPIDLVSGDAVITIRGFEPIAEFTTVGDRYHNIEVRLDVHEVLYQAAVPADLSTKDLALELEGSPDALKSSASFRTFEPTGPERRPSMFRDLDPKGEYVVVLRYERSIVDNGYPTRWSIGNVLAVRGSDVAFTGPDGESDRAQFGDAFGRAVSLRAGASAVDVLVELESELEAMRLGGEAGVIVGTMLPRPPADPETAAYVAWAAGEPRNRSLDLFDLPPSERQRRPARPFLVVPEAPDGSRAVVLRTEAGRLITAPLDRIVSGTVHPAPGETLFVSIDSTVRAITADASAERAGTFGSDQWQGGYAIRLAIAANGTVSISTVSVDEYNAELAKHAVAGTPRVEGQPEGAGQSAEKGR